MMKFANLRLLSFNDYFSSPQKIMPHHILRCEESLASGLFHFREIARFPSA
jgi:hypothetical protein